MSIVPTTARITRPEMPSAPAVFTPAADLADAISQRLAGPTDGAMRLPYESVIVTAETGGAWTLVEGISADWFQCPYSEQGPLRIWPGRERPTLDFTGSLGTTQRPLELREGGCVRLPAPTRIWWIWSPAPFSNATVNVDRALVLAGVSGSACQPEVLDWDLGRPVRTPRNVAALDGTEATIRLADARSREMWVQNPPGAVTNVAIGGTGAVNADSGSEDGHQLSPGQDMIIGPRLGAMDDWFAIRSTGAAAHPLVVFDFRRTAPWEIEPTG
jgi:hypothetical protein